MELKHLNIDGETYIRKQASNEQTDATARIRRKNIFCTIHSTLTSALSHGKNFKRPMRSLITGMASKGIEQQSPASDDTKLLINEETETDEGILTIE